MQNDNNERLKTNNELFKRKTISVSLPEDLIRWIEDQAQDDVYIRDRSHCIEIAVTEFKEKRNEKNS